MPIIDINALFKDALNIFTIISNQTYGKGPSDSRSYSWATLSD